MRIRVHLRAPPPIMIPLNYAHQLASVVYHLLDRSSPAYATFLHGQGYGTGDRRFKLFTFSPLLDHPRQVVAGHLRFETGAVSWYITSPVEAFIFLAADAWGHSVSLLLGRFPKTYRPLGAIIDGAKELDKHCIPSCYPNGFDKGGPLDYYTTDEATRSIGHAQAILAFCEGHIHQPRTDPHSPEEPDPGVDPTTSGA